MPYQLFTEAQKITIENCIRRLKNYSRFRFLSSEKYSYRAKFIATTLQECLNENNFTRAKDIIIDQIKLFASPNDVEVTDSRRSLYIRATQFLESPKEKDTFNEYYIILYQTYRAIFKGLHDVSDTEPGVALIHRIWVGGPLREERLKKMIVANTTIANLWRQPDDESKKVNVQSVLWTDNKALFESAGAKFSKTSQSAKLYPQIRHIDELFNDDISKKLMPHIRSMITTGEFSFATDILRQIIMFKYGGLFLGMPWEKLSDIPLDYFQPTTSTLKFLTVDTLDEFFFLRQPFTALGTGGYELNFQSHTITHPGQKRSDPNTVGLTSLVGTDAMYCGCQGHPIYKLTQIIQHELLNAMTKNENAAYFTNYRLAIRKIIPALIVAQKKDEADKKISSIKKHPGLVLDPYPITQALMDLGYLVPQPHEIERPGAHYIIPSKYKFYVGEPMDGNYDFVIDQLNIARKNAMRWMKPHPTPKLSGEI